MGGEGWSGPVPPQDGVPVGAGQRDDVDGDADPGGFEDVRVSADGPEVDRDVAGEADDVAGLTLVPEYGTLGPARCAPEFRRGWCSPALT